MNGHRLAARIDSKQLVARRGPRPKARVSPSAGIRLERPDPDGLDDDLIGRRWSEIPHPHCQYAVEPAGAPTHADPYLALASRFRPRSEALRDARRLGSRQRRRQRNHGRQHARHDVSLQTRDLMCLHRFPRRQLVCCVSGATTPRRKPTPPSGGTGLVGLRGRHQSMIACELVSVFSGASAISSPRSRAVNNKSCGGWSWGHIRPDDSLLPGRARAMLNDRDEARSRFHLCAAEKAARSRSLIGPTASILPGCVAGRRMRHRARAANAPSAAGAHRLTDCRPS